MTARTQKVLTRKLTKSTQQKIILDTFDTDDLLTSSLYKFTAK